MFQSTNIVIGIFLINLFLDSSYQRSNLAQRHPCYSTNKRLEPLIQWTEHLVSSQYGVPENACEKSDFNMPICCTNEIFTSFTQSFADELKKLSDTELNQLKNLMSISKTHLELGIKQYISKSRFETSSSLEILFGIKEYEYHIHHVLISLYRTLDNSQSTDINVSNSINDLFHQLTISMYRHFMSKNQDLTFDYEFENCLKTQALNHNIFTFRRELLYALTGASSIMQILRTLFIYIDADIQRLKQTTTFRSYPYIQYYTNQMLCSICRDQSLTNRNDGLCENDCRFIVENCLNQTDNPYIRFATNAQGYLNVIQHIRQSIIELKIVERLSKFPIYLYDMIVNVTNTQKVYTKLQRLCPNRHEKSFHSIQTISPIRNQQIELVQQWNQTFHHMLNEIQSSLINLHVNLTQQISQYICSNANYAIQSVNCTNKNLRATIDFSSLSSALTIDLYSEPTKDQIDDLEKKLAPMQNMIESLRPKKKFSIHDDLPILDYDINNQTDEYDFNDENKHNIPISLVIENKDQHMKNRQSFSENLYDVLDGKLRNETMSENKNSIDSLNSIEEEIIDNTSPAFVKQTTNRARIRTTTENENVNISSSLTCNIVLYVSVVLLLLTN